MRRSPRARATSGSSHFAPYSRQEPRRGHDIQPGGSLVLTSSISSTGLVSVTSNLLPEPTVPSFVAGNHLVSDRFFICGATRKTVPHHLPLLEGEWSPTTPIPGLDTSAKVLPFQDSRRVCPRRSRVSLRQRRTWNLRFPGCRWGIRGARRAG